MIENVSSSLEFDYRVMGGPAPRRAQDPRAIFEGPQGSRSHGEGEEVGVAGRARQVVCAPAEDGRGQLPAALDSISFPICSEAKDGCYNS